MADMLLRHCADRKKRVKVRELLDDTLLCEQLLMEEAAKAIMASLPLRSSPACIRFH